MRFNGLNWDVQYLGEQALLLDAGEGIAIEHIHASAHAIQQLLGSEIHDLVPSYHSIALFFEGAKERHLLRMLESSSNAKLGGKVKKEQIEIPVCYELGLDLEEVAAHAGMSIEDVITMHLSGTYRAILIGFTPGFVYADGLNEKLACPRKANPRKRLKAGSIGIGGAQTGIYSLDGPGGWNIIGRTPVALFDENRNPPLRIDVGATFRFFSITKAKFETWQG